MMNESDDRTNNMSTIYINNSSSSICTQLSSLVDVTSQQSSCDDPALIVTNNYLKERVYWNILTILNPGPSKIPNLTAELPDFVFNPNSRQHLLNQANDILKQRTLNVRPRSPSVGRPLSRTLSPERRPRTPLKEPTPKLSIMSRIRREEQHKTRMKMSIEEQIEKDILKELRKLKLEDEKIKRNELLGERAVTPKQLINISRPESSQSTRSRGTTSRQGSRPSTACHKLQAPGSDFVFSNPNNVYVPSEYDYILFDDLDDNPVLTLNKVRHDSVKKYQQKTRPKKKSRSESKDNTKKVLLNQFELTSALSSQLSELNKKKVKRKSFAYAF